MLRQNYGVFPDRFSPAVTMPSRLQRSPENPIRSARPDRVLEYNVWIQYQFIAQYLGAQAVVGIDVIDPESGAERADPFHDRKAP